MASSALMRRFAAARVAIGAAVGLGVFLPALHAATAAQVRPAGTIEHPKAMAPRTGPRAHLGMLASDGRTRDTGGVGVLACGEPLVPLDRARRLEANCVPSVLVSVPARFAIGSALLAPEAADALVSMLTAAAEGVTAFVVSAYRSYDEQEWTFAYWVSRLGEEAAKRLSARPGHSEHQLGTTVDFSVAELAYELDEAFALTPAGVWLAANARHYGFVLSYPQGFEGVTGYAFEPWHFRYVGRPLAYLIISSGQAPIAVLSDRWAALTGQGRVTGRSVLSGW